MADRLGAPRLLAEVSTAIDAVARYLTPTMAAAASSLHRRLQTPLRVALVGRVNAGKSTLLNALVGHRTAPTNETECTRVATWYRFGAPARVDVVAMDRSISTIPVHQRLPEDLGRPAAEIDFVVVYLPSALLRDYELIDTPGLGTTHSTSSAATRRALGRGVDRGLARPDGTLFLTDGAPRADEVAILTEIGATRIDTLALLSHADTFGEGAFGSIDPLDMAAKHAERLANQLTRLASGVLPVAGLMAETALTGHLTEDDTRGLRQLSGYEDFELAGILAGQADFPGVDVARLLELVGAYGIVNGRSAAQRGAAVLTRWLADKSGLMAVQAEITRRFLRRSEVLKARSALAELRELGAESPHRHQIDAILESARMSPQLHPLRELSALELMLSWDATHPLVTELDHVGVAQSTTELLLVPADADEASITKAAQQACLRCRRERLTASSAAEREAWTVLERSYQLLFSPH